MESPLYGARALECLEEMAKVWQPARLLTYAGPYKPNEHLLQNYLQSVATNEEYWYRKIMLEDHEEENIFKVFPASFACVNAWGKQCPMHRICYKESSAADNPTGSGEYVIRRPHHAGDLAAQKAAGIQPPPQWDDED